MQYESQQEFPICFATLGVADLVIQGHKIAPHIIRMNLIIAELYGNNDPTCENCFSLNLIESSIINPEYKDAEAPYWHINALGSIPAQPSRRYRRDRTEKKLTCNFCTHIVSTHTVWSDWYEVDIYSSREILIISPQEQRDPPSIWSPNDMTDYVAREIWTGDSSGGNKWTSHTAVPRGYGISIKTNGTGIDFG